MDRDRVIQDTARATRGHGPSIRASILVEPFLQPIETLPKTSTGHGYPDPALST
jgi:hypothetical protein